LDGIPHGSPKLCLIHVLGGFIPIGNDSRGEFDQRIDASERRGFTTAARPNEYCYSIGRDVQGYVLESLSLTILYRNSFCPQEGGSVSKDGMRR
jgi:hypothetical protein